MGKTKKKTYVSSTVYNLAGDTEKENVLKTTVLAGIFSQQELGNFISDSYRNGHGVRLRRFARLARTSGYTQHVVMQREGKLNLPLTIPESEIRSFLKNQDPSKREVNILSVERDIASYNYWAMREILRNSPANIDDYWIADFNDSTGQVTITFLGGSEVDYEEDGTPIYPPDYEPPVLNTYSFTPEGFNKSSEYLYCVYTYQTSLPDGDTVQYPRTPVSSIGNIPNISEFSKIQTRPESHSISLSTLTRTTTVYADGRDNDLHEDTTHTPTSYTNVEEVYERISYRGRYLLAEDQGGDYTYSENVTIFALSEKIVETVYNSHTTSGVSVDGVEYETTVETFSEVLVDRYSYVYQTQDIEIRGNSTPDLFIYRLGSGNQTFDRYVGTSKNLGMFLPHIPVRAWKQNISPSNAGSLYTHSNTALKKAIGSSLPAIIKLMNSSKSLNDIDHAFINFAVPINEKSQEGIKYLYHFFQQLLEGSNPSKYASWKNVMEDINSVENAWYQWQLAQMDENHPLFGTPAPNRVTVPQAPGGSFGLSSAHYEIDFDVRISWSNIREDVYEGKLSPNAAVGTFKSRKGVAELSNSVNLYLTNGIVYRGLTTGGSPIQFMWQHSENNYRVITVYGLVYHNYVYKGKYVSYNAYNEMGKSGDSGFLVPLHEETLRTFPLISLTQLASSCAYIIFNSYQVVKKKWYQSSFFKILIVVVVVVVAAFSGGAGAGFAGAAGGIGGSAAAAVGVTGLVATAIAVAVNVTVSIIISSIISKASTAAFGEKWGAIIGTIASIVVMGTMNGQFGTEGAGWADGYRSLMQPQNLLRISEAVGEGISADLSKKAQKYYEEFVSITADYEKKSEEIAELFKQHIGDGSSVDLWKIQEMVSKVDVKKEYPNEFLERTLLVGSDVVEMAQSMIDDFATITTSLKLP